MSGMTGVKRRCPCEDGHDKHKKEQPAHLAGCLAFLDFRFGEDA